MEKQYTPKKAKTSQLASKSNDAKASNAELAKAPAQQSKPVDKEESKDAQKSETKTEAKVEEKIGEQKTDQKAEQTAEKKDEKKVIAKVKKEEAIAKGLNLHASKKHCMYICSFIKNKPIDLAISELQDVIKLKRPIPFKGEIPHRGYPGMMSGRYPVSASKQFINILKALKGNVIVNGMEIEKTRITFGSANWASRPQKRGGARFKRTHVLLKAMELSDKHKVKEEKK